MTKNKTAPVVLMAALAVCVSVLAAGAQSLADVARREAARRESVKTPAKVVTNNDLRAVASAAPVVPPVAAGDPGVEPPAAGGAPADAAAERLPEAPDPTRSQEYWRKRIADARQARDHNAFLLEAIQSRINALTADFSARDDPFQRAQIQTNRQNAIAELDRMTKTQVELERKISDIEEEARRANVPPGWLR
jgi:cell division protein FtsB